MTFPLKSKYAAIIGGLAASLIGFAYYKFNGGNLEFIYWATEDRWATAWLISGIAIGAFSFAKIGGPPSTNA